MKRKSNILYLSSNEKNVEKKVSTELEEKGVVVVENFITQKQCDELMMQLNLLAPNTRVNILEQWAM